MRRCHIHVVAQLLQGLSPKSTASTNDFVFLLPSSVLLAAAKNASLRGGCGSQNGIARAIQRKFYKEKPANDQERTELPPRSTAILDRKKTALIKKTPETNQATRPAGKRHPRSGRRGRRRWLEGGRRPTGLESLVLGYRFHVREVMVW